MAQMVPESLSAAPSATRGEAWLYRLLQARLDADTIVWFDVAMRGRYADFVVLDPRRGLLVLEVKDWRLDRMRRVTPARVVLATADGEKTVAHPLTQVRGYALRLVDALAADPRLLCPGGPYRGRLALPFGYGVVWTNIRERAFRDLLPELADAPMLFRDSLAGAVEPGAFATRLFSLMPFSFPVALTPEQVDAVRYQVFPEVRLPRPRRVAADAPSQPRLAPPGDVLAVMDLAQERLAKSLGDGHRLLRGVAGSGKTVTLVCRARLLAEAFPTWRILVLCYNVSLAAFLRQMIARRSRAATIEVVNFHAFLAPLARAGGVERPVNPAWAEEVSEALCTRADAGEWTPPRYDAILIDEAHDFHSSWLRLAVACLNPETNSLFVVHDSAQNIYRKGFSFKKVGMQVRGRTRVLRTNYRNTREIAELASSFLSRGVRFDDGDAPRDDEGQLLEIIRPVSTPRSGPAPALVRCATFREECAETAARIKHWIERGHYPPPEILVLYVRRGPAAGNDRYIRALLEALGEAGVPYEWISRDRHAKQGFSTDSWAVKVSTIHSAKGLDFAAVAMVGVSLLPTSPEHEEAERKLVYVGLTRARDSLLVTYCKESKFVRELLDGE